MEDDPTSAAFDVADIEAELCRLPDVAAVRIVADPVGRLTEVHVLAETGKPAKQLVRDVQSVALASYGLEIDRRIVSVVQLGTSGTTAQLVDTRPDTARTVIVALQSHTAQLRTTFQVTLGHGEEEATGFAEGTISGSTHARLIASAALDALRQLEPGAESLDVDSAQLIRIGARDVVIVSLVNVEPPVEHYLTGSAVVRYREDDAVVRAVLDATNRRFPRLPRERDPL
jgi:hypothetical protein